MQNYLILGFIGLLCRSEMAVGIKIFTCAALWHIPYIILHLKSWNSSSFLINFAQLSEKFQQHITFKFLYIYG